MQEMQVSSLEVEMTTHSSILAWIISWTEEPKGLQSKEMQSRTQLTQLGTHTQRQLLTYKLKLLDVIAHRM